MRRIGWSYLFICLLFIPGDIAAQVFYQYDTSVKVFAYGKEQTTAWCGGFNNPQFGSADLNHDGIADLVAFEPGLGVATFLNYAPAGSAPNYRYAPEYALNFPACYSYMTLADYNCDGIADLFQRGSSGFSAYRGYYNAYNQLCFTFYKDLFYSNDGSSGLANAYVNPGDIPAIVDVDGDGDLDFASYYITGGFIYYYKNMRAELGLPCDSIHIALKDRCWGKVYQGFYRAHTLSYSCSNTGLRPGEGEKRTHSGNTPCLFDWDLDGDMDYLDGSVSFNEMTFLKNGRVEQGSGPDSMVAQDSLWQTGGRQIAMPVWPTAYNIDVDQDGRKDLLIAPNAGSGSENYNCIWYYKNRSTPGTANWEFQSDSFLIDKTIDLGSGTYPTLFDYNKDGKPDLIVGSDGYRQSTGLLDSRLSLYLNTSVPGSASFTLQTKDMAGIGAQHFQGAAPATGDLDGDGIADLVIGHSNGTLSYYRNMAASDAVPPDWQLAALQLQDADGNVINTDGNAAPFIYDIDRDGRKDLLIGSIYGYIQYFRNISTTPGTISLKLVNTRLGNAKADPQQVFGNYSTPFIGNIDDSGTEYLLMGSNSGNIYKYTGFQSGDTTATYTLVDGQYSFIDSTCNLYNSPGTFYGIYGNRRTSLTVGDIDGSGSLAMITGNTRGGLEFYKRKAYVAAIPAPAEEVKVLVYPNPAQDVLNISWAGLAASSQLDITIVNMAGQRFGLSSVPSSLKHTSLNLSAFPAGVYICLLQNGGNRYHSKFTIIR